MRRITVCMAFLLLTPALWAQVVELNLQKCREMALESSRKIQIAGQQELKAGFEKKAYRANFLPKLSATGLYAYMQKKMEYQIDGGYLPTYVPGPDGQLQPNLLINAAGQPVTGADGNYVFNQYAFMPDINLALSLRNAYTLIGRAHV